MSDGAKVEYPANTGSRRGCRAYVRGELSYSPSLPSSRMSKARMPSMLAVPISAFGVASCWRYFRSLGKGVPIGSFAGFDPLS